MNMIRREAATTISDICYAQQQIAHITNIFLNFLQHSSIYRVWLLHVGTLELQSGKPKHTLELPCHCTGWMQLTELCRRC